MTEIGTLDTEVVVKGEGPDVILVHGVVETLDVWRPTMEVFKNQHRLVAYNTRGHGGATATDGDYSLDAYAQDIKNIIDEYCDGHAKYLIAHSFGCVHTQRLLQQHDDLVDRAFLFHSTAESAEFAEGEGFLERVARYKKREIQREFFKTFCHPFNLFRPEAPTMLMNNPRWLKNTVDEIQVPPEDIRGDIKEAMHFDYTEKNKQIDQDVTVVGATNDELVKTGEIEELHESIPSSRLEWINSGHMSMFFPPYFDLLFSPLG